MGSNNQQGQFQRRPQTQFNDYRYPMPASEAPVDGAKYPARWTWEMGLDGKIYFKVNDGVFGKDDRNAKSKEVHLSNMDRNALFQLMREACDNAQFTKAQYHVKQITFGQGGRLNDHPSTLGIFTVIRTQEGKIQVGYTKGTYKVMFVFNSPFESIIMVQKDGEVHEDKGLMSRVYCKAFIEYCTKFLDQYEWEQYKPRERKDQGNNNNGGNNNRGGNGGWNNNQGGGNNWGGNNNSGGNQGGGRSAPPVDFDDTEIDF